MATLREVELGVLGPLQVRQYGLPVSIPGAKPRAVLTMLGLHGGSVVTADTLLELLWGDEPPRTAAKALQTHISSLRRALGDGFVLTVGTGWTLSTTEIDATRYKLSAKRGRDAVAAGDAGQAVAHFDEALSLWRGSPELPDGPRGTSEMTRWLEAHAALVEDRADALLTTGRAAEIIGELEAAVADAPLRERRWGQLMLALYRAGRQGEALGAYQRARSLLADELGVDPGPDLRRLEAAIVAQDQGLEIPASQQLLSVTRAVTFLLTDIEGSTAAWEADSVAMAAALARHDEIVEQIVTSRGGRLVKTRGEGDATFSVFDRPSAAAASAIDLQEAIRNEPWVLRSPMRVRVALHTGEVELRDGDYFGRAVNRAARLRSVAAGGQILCSGATAELVIDALPDDVLLVDLGTRQLRNLVRPEHVFELRLETADDSHAAPAEEPFDRPGLPAVLAGGGPFVGRSTEIERLMSAWDATLASGARAVLIAGEPGVGKTRLAGEWSRRAYQRDAVVLYGRCDEDLGAPYQPFAEALRSLAPCLGASRLRGVRGIEALSPLIPGLTDLAPDLAAAPHRADPDTERYALFDAVVALLGLVAASAPVVLILDDLHWAAKPTLLLLRHLLRFGEHARVQIVGTYRSTDLDRSHPLAAMLADLHRDGSADRLQLSGLDEDDVTAYVAEAGYDDDELARALASVTGGNPFFLIEALRHVDESGGRWDPSTLPQGVREAVSRRLSRLPVQTNKALAAAAVVGSRFALELVERVVGEDLVDDFDAAAQAGIVIEESGGRYRFNHAIVRQSLLAELASVRRMRLHQRIAVTLEQAPGADDELLSELAYHYFECAWAGNAGKAVDYCRRAADQAMARLAYEGAADLYDKALHALDELDDELPDRDDRQAELLVARCEALLAAGDVTSARGAVSQLQAAAGDSAHLAAWGMCFDGQVSMLTDPERLDEIEADVAAAAQILVGLDDAAGEAKAHTVRAGCLARLGRIGDAETALDQALTAARRAGEHRRVNAVLANAPLAALWGPNPVPRAGGRCLDVVRLLRITTGSPIVEATSTRCQGVLDAFRGRAAAARQLIDSARRSLTELGMRHALLEVDQFAGLVELVADDAAAAEPHLRRAYEGFRRMGLDADTAQTAALLARACLALDRNAEADELCAESERLAGHALQASIAWRTVRAQLLARRGDHDDARRVAEEAVTIAGRTDALVDHGDACLALATVLGDAGDAVGARRAAERALELYELKGAAALAEKARCVIGERAVTAAPTPREAPAVELNNACTRVGLRVAEAVNRKEWNEVEQLYASDVSVESRRKIVGFVLSDLAPGEWVKRSKHVYEAGGVRLTQVVIAVRGERLALIRLLVDTADASPGAPYEEFLQVYGIDDDGRINMQVWFDLEDMDAAFTELDAAHARAERESPRTRLANAASRVEDRCYRLFSNGRADEIAALLADEHVNEDRRQGFGRVTSGRATAMANIHAIAALDVDLTYTPLALRGNRLCLSQVLFERRERQLDAFSVETLELTEIDADGMMIAKIVFDAVDMDGAIAELDARYGAGEAAAHAHTWSIIAGAFIARNRRELPTLMTSTPISIDHRRMASFGNGEGIDYVRAGWDLDQDLKIYIEEVHRISELGAVFTWAGHGISREGFTAEWRAVELMTVTGGLLNRAELFDEADLDAALARFDELSRPTLQLENAVTRTCERLRVLFAERDWVAIADLFADGYSLDDRRRTVNSGMRLRRDVAIDDIRAAVDVGLWANLSSAAIATRGGRLALLHLHASGHDPKAVQSDVLQVIEIDADERIVARVSFDLDDIDAAFAELDVRYLAGEAAPYSQTWSVVVAAYAGFNRREISATTPDWVSIDHRRGTAFAPGDMVAYLEAAWDDSPDTKIHIAAVHRLSSLGAVITHVAHGISRVGFDAEWRDTHLLTVADDMVSRSELFDDSDLDAALARFEELSRPASQPHNAAIDAYERFNTHYVSGDWDALVETLADDFFTDDRRRFVGMVGQRGRDAAVAHARATAELGVAKATSTVVATRGERIALMRSRYSGSDRRPDAFHAEVLHAVEIDADQRISSFVEFDLDDIDSAIAELDARYAAGEAAAYARTWSAVSAAYTALNRQQLPARTPDFVDVDHRRGAAIAPGGLSAYLHAAWNNTSRSDIFIEVIHRLSSSAAVVTHVALGTTREGFEAEWRVITVLTLDGDLVNRVELFDEADLDAALARFDELCASRRRSNSPASELAGRFCAYFATRDWSAMRRILAQDLSVDDRRRVVGAGLRQGREAEIENLRAWAEVGIEDFTFDVIAARGRRLALCRTRWSKPASQAFLSEALGIVEITDDNEIAARVMFDLDDIDAAFTELDARYLAGEARPYAHTWSAVASAYTALNRHELPATTVDHVSIDRRRTVSFAPGEIKVYTRFAWDQVPDITFRIAVVHRLSDRGAVVTHVLRGTSREGFEAEWREIHVLMVEGDLFNRSEMYDEDDLDAALARLEELSRSAPQLGNAASQTYGRMWSHFASRDWAAMAESLATDVLDDDRRRVVNAGVRRGREALIENVRAIAEVGGEDVTSFVVATRGKRLALSRVRFSVRGGEVIADVLNIAEIDVDNRIMASVIFDLDDIDAAFAELEARYLAGEAAAHAQTWSFISGAFAGFDRHELPPTSPDWVNIDHRQVMTHESGGLYEFVRSSWDLVPDIRNYVEAVHRLSDFGAVVTRTAEGTSREGFGAEWRLVTMVLAEDRRISRVEVFDESDLDAALARFDELSQPASRFENAASQVYEHIRSRFGARDWDAISEVLASDISIDDRRRVVSAPPVHGRAAEIANMRAIAAVGTTTITSTVVATRGSNLVLGHTRFSGPDRRSQAFHTDVLDIVEVNSDGRVVAHVVFDPDDMDAAFAELDSRYLAGEAGEHPHVWSVIAEANAALNRREFPANMQDCVSVDHRRVYTVGAGLLTANIQAGWDLAPDWVNRMVAVHQLTSLGAVITRVANGTSHDGFEAEWRSIVCLTIDGQRISRVEFFHESDLDAALARFDELNATAPQLDNAATRARTRIVDETNRRDMAALVALGTADSRYEDRRKGLAYEGPAGAEVVRALFEAIQGWQLEMEPVAIRGSRLALTRDRYRDTTDPGLPITGEHLTLTEVDDDGLVADTVLFDTGDIDDALRELTARCIASGEVAHIDVIAAARDLNAAYNGHD